MIWWSPGQFQLLPPLPLNYVVMYWEGKRNEKRRERGREMRREREERKGKREGKDGKKKGCVQLK